MGKLFLIFSEVYQFCNLHCYSVDYIERGEAIQGLGVVSPQFFDKRDDPYNYPPTFFQ